MAEPVQGRADFLALGDWNAACSMCGKKRKASTLVRNWQGLYRCPEHNEPRQPQDYVRGVKDDMSVPWAQIEQIQFVTFTPTFPLKIDPNPVKLMIGNVQLTTEAYIPLTTQYGSILCTEALLIAAVIPLFPSWVTPETYYWSWNNAGEGINIDSPNAPTTTLSTSVYPAQGTLQCTITNSLGYSATATAFVTT